jgi:hypothetical protein
MGQNHKIWIIFTCMMLAMLILTVPAAQAKNTAVKETKNADKKIVITAGSKKFNLSLYDNEAAKKFATLLPLTVNMSELNGNEKYCYLSESLPTKSERPSGIQKGDLMLYGSDCLVLFYESFSTSYSYTALGKIDDPEGLE